MTPERYKQVKELFLEALDRPADVRTTFVIARTTTDLELRKEVEALLRHHKDEDNEPELKNPVPDQFRSRNAPTQASIPEPTKPELPSLRDEGEPGPSYRSRQPLVAPPVHVPQGLPEVIQASLAPREPHTPRASIVPPPDVERPPGSHTHSRMRIDHGRFAPGTLLVDRYRIVELIARGGMGEVYRAEDLKLGEPVALKFLPAALAGNPEWLERFLDEVRAARNVAHPNVCRVYDVSEVRGEHFISMEYVDGETLSSLTSRIGRVPPKKAGELAQQLCAGLSAIHDQGILHRDLKPSNLLIDSRGQLKVTDFGLAVPGEVKGYQAAAGTPGYVAPEALAGTEATVKSDIYALGLVLFELYTGTPAYVATPGVDLIKQQTKTDPPAPSTVAPDIKPSVEKAIMACLERDPKDRPATVRQVALMLPGIDPLAAALSAGETPSPSLVALSGREGILKIWEAAAIFALFAGLLVAATVLSGRASLLRVVAIQESGPVLAFRARQILTSLGYKDLHHDAFAFDLYEELLTEMEENDRALFATLESAEDRREAAAESLERLKRERPAPVDFWYRCGPNPLWTQKPTGVITFTDPPFNNAGMISVRLTPGGKLRELTVLDRNTYTREDPPEEALSKGPLGPPADFSPLFDAAGLDQTLFRSVKANRIPPVFADFRVAWEGVYPENPDESIRVEAASLEGRIVAFRTIEDRYPNSQDVKPQTRPSGQNLSLTIGAVLGALSLIGAAVLARRNVVAHRGDFAGAWRSAIASGGATLGTLLLAADTLRGDNWRLEHLPWVLGASLFGGGVIWVLYIAVEPVVRRIWPEVMVTWSRLIMGRFVDPLVGQSLLIGATFGVLGMCCVYLRVMFPTWLGMPPARPFYEPQVGVAAINGFREALAQLCKCALLSIQAGVVPLVAVVLIKMVVRKTWVALAIMSAVQAVIWGVYTPSTWASWLVFAGLSGVAVVVLVRYGMLALICGAFVYYAGVSAPVAFDSDRWYPRTAIIFMIVIVAIAAYGGVISVIGKANRSELA